MRLPRAVRILARSKSFRIILDIGMDMLIAMALLFALSTVHDYLMGIQASPAFKEYFSNCHEWTCLGTYGLLCIKGLIRIAFR